MGGSRPSPPTVAMPSPTAPTLYQSVIPFEDYQALAEQLNRIQTETGKIQKQRYQEVGTPAEIGARQAGRRAQEAASYLASLPSGDQYLSSLTGRKDQFKPAREAAQENLTEAQRAYGEALQKVSAVGEPEPTISETPAWAKRTIPEAMPKTAAQAPASAPVPEQTASAASSGNPFADAYQKATGESMLDAALRLSRRSLKSG